MTPPPPKDTDYQRGLGVPVWLCMAALIATLIGVCWLVVLLVQLPRGGQ